VEQDKLVIFNFNPKSEAYDIIEPHKPEILITMDVSKRLISLDVFRGITIAGMIMVNNPGSWSEVYGPLLHADWHGCTPTDWVFPFFLFIMGVAVPLSIGKQMEKGVPGKKIVGKIIRRTILIFAIGLFLNAFPYFNLSTLRIPGVLQRIALVYCATALIYYKTKPRSHWVIALALLLAYWAIMTLIPVPGGIAPNLEPDTNIGAWFDRLLLEGHLWSQSKTWDPEGLFSTIPAIVTGLSGMICGQWIKSKRGHYEKLTAILVAGVVLVALGHIWDLAFPLNKKLWTSSFVLYTSGLALMFLGVVYYLIDVLEIKKWSFPFKVYGMNALFTYVLSGILATLMGVIKWTTASGDVLSVKGWVYQNLFMSWLAPKSASLGYALFNVVVIFLVAWVLYRKRIFIKV